MPILVLDFDGVMHSYSSGWQGVDWCPDPPVPGLEAFLAHAMEHFQVQVHSSRSAVKIGREAMRAWCQQWLREDIARELTFPRDKPPAFVTLDDRALTFTGQWPAVETLLAFQPWTRNTLPPNELPQEDTPHA